MAPAASWEHLTQALGTELNTEFLEESDALFFPCCLKSCFSIFYLIANFELKIIDLVQKLLVFCGNTKTCNKFSKGTEEMQQTRNSGVFLSGEKHLYPNFFLLYWSVRDYDQHEGYFIWPCLKSKGNFFPLSKTFFPLRVRLQLCCRRITQSSRKRQMLWNIRKCWSCWTAMGKNHISKIKETGNRVNRKRKTVWT